MTKTPTPCGCEIKLDPATGKLTIVCCSYEHIDTAHHELEQHRATARHFPPPLGPRTKGSQVN